MFVRIAAIWLTAACSMPGLVHGTAHAADAAGLTILQSEPPRSLDPADQTATVTGAVLDPLYEGLVAFDEHGRIAPVLALSWSRDASGLDWTFQLRHRVRFQDGTAMDSAAVAASFERLLSLKRGLAGSGPFREVIASVSATAPDQVRLHLRRPYAFLLPLLATSQAGIVSPLADHLGTLATRPVGTGPFRFAVYRTGTDVLEERNPDYWGQKPHLAWLKWTWSSEVSVLNMAIRTGDADVVDPIAPVFAASIAADPKLRLIRSPGSALYWVALNTTLPPLNDVRVRQALALATDRRGLVQALLRGLGTPADGPLPPAMPDHDPYPSGAVTDLARARGLLASSGHGSGIKLSVAVQEPEEPIAEALQAMWANVGVDLQIRRMEAGVWTQAAFEPPEAKRRDRLDAVIASWSAGSVADHQLRPLYATSSLAPAGANLGFYSDPELDRLLDRAAATYDDQARRALYDAAIERIALRAPAVQLFVRDTLIAARKAVTGLWTRPDGTLVVTGATLPGTP